MELMRLYRTMVVGVIVNTNPINVNISKSTVAEMHRWNNPQAKGILKLWKNASKVG